MLPEGFPAAFWTVLGTPSNALRALLAALGHPTSALGAARVRFGRPKYRHKSRPGAILVTLAVQERFGDDFRPIFDRFSSIFG